MAGYMNSQSWEAWFDSIHVLWDNTEIIFLASVILSVGTVLFTWFKYPKTQFQDLSTDSINLAECNFEGTEDFGDDAEEIIETDDIFPCNFDSSSSKESSLHLSTKQLTKELENQMSEEERNKEIEARNLQLQAIFKLMKEQEDKFGDPSMDDIKNQMKFYCG